MLYFSKFSTFFLPEIISVEKIWKAEDSFINNFSKLLRNCILKVEIFNLFGVFLQCQIIFQWKELSTVEIYLKKTQQNCLKFKRNFLNGDENSCKLCRKSTAICERIQFKQYFIYLMNLSGMENKESCVETSWAFGRKTKEILTLITKFEILW